MAFFKGNPITGRIPESLRLWVWSKSHGDFMHLPHEGGIYDQHPILLEHWLIIDHTFHEHQENEEQKKKLRDKSKNMSRR